MSRALKSFLAASAITGMAAFVIAHAPAAHAQDQAPAPAAAPAAPAAADDLPPGGDHDLVKATCTVCHASTQFSSQRHTQQEWNDVVTQMGAMGATIPPDDVPRIVAYLTANFGAPAAAAVPAGATPAPGAADGAAPAAPAPAPAQ